MDAPKPPFHSVTDELLYSIYLKLTASGEGLTPPDINTLAKLNAILTDAELVSVVMLSAAINALKGNVPEAGNNLEKLYGIIQGLNYLSAEDIDTLGELNAILGDPDLVKSIDLTTSIQEIKDNVPEAGNTLAKLYNIIQGLNYLSAQDIDTLAELNAILGDADLVKTIDLTTSIEGIKGNVPEAGNTLAKLYDLVSSQSAQRSVQFRFNASGTVYEILLFKGKIGNLSHDFTASLASIMYRSRLDTSNSWVDHSTLNSLQSWITVNVTGNEINGTKYWIKSIATYKQGRSGEAACAFYFTP